MSRPYRIRKDKDSGVERRLLIGMISNDQFLRDIKVIYRPELIKAPFARTVATWCLDHHNKFSHSPGPHIEDRYKKAVRRGELDDEQEQLIGELLASLSEESERLPDLDPQVLLKDAEREFRRRAQHELGTALRNAAGNEDPEAADRVLSEYRRVELPQDDSVDPFTDRDGLIAAWENAAEPLFRLPGAAGKFLNNLFIRDAFVTLLGPDKRGKTWRLIDLALWANRSGCPVAFFSAGDMTLPQMRLRFGTALTGRNYQPRFCKEQLVPVLDCARNQNDTCDKPQRAGDFSIMKDEVKGTLQEWEEAKDHRPCTYCLRKPGGEYKGAVWRAMQPAVTPLEWHEALQAGERAARRCGLKAGRRLVCRSAGTLTVQNIDDTLHFWKEKSGFVPSVVVVDYMKLLAPEKNAPRDFRLSEGHKWERMRRLGQDWNCLVLSADQTDAGAYTIPWIGMQNFSESREKNAHVTGMVTLNQTREEKKMGIMRLGKLLTREDEFDDHSGVTVLQHLPYGKPLIASYL